MAVSVAFQASAHPGCPFSPGQTGALKARSPAKEFEEVPSCCTSVQKSQVGLFAWGKIPSSSQILNQLPESSRWWRPMREGQVSGVGQGSASFWKLHTFPRNRSLWKRENEAAQLKWWEAWAASFIVFEVCFTLPNLKKKKKKKKTVNAAFPPQLHPSHLRNSGGQKRGWY